MYLKKLAIINYKSCRDLILDFYGDSPNTFIGRTDSGKTTILQTIGLLLNDKYYPVMLQEGHETSDISTTPITESRYKEIFKTLNLPLLSWESEPSIIVVGIFCKENGDLGNEFDENASNHLKWSIECSASEEIPIVRQFSSSFPNGRYLLCSKEDVGEKRELWRQNKTTLDAIIEKNGITKEDITNDNKAGVFKNIEKFRAIYNRLKTSLQWANYDEFAKKDRMFFPVYRYIDWREITLKSVEDMAKDTMSSTIEEYSNKLKVEAGRLGKEATEKVNSELEKKITTIISGLPSVTAIKAKVFFKSDETISEISVEKQSSDGSVRLESQGDGVKKQIGFAFMRLAALDSVKVKTKSKKFLWGFDEPEAHLYPPEKRDFYETIKQLSFGIFQTFISTHSTVFVDKSKIDTIRKVQLIEKYTNVSMCNSVMDVHSSLGIRNSDFLFYDNFIACEGDSDQILISHFYKLFFGKTIEEDAIQFITLGGGNRRAENQKLLEQVMKDFNDPNDCVYYVLDKDTKASGANIFLVGKYDIEDSIDDKFWITLTKDTCGIDLSVKNLKKIRDELGDESDKKFHKLLSDFVNSKENKNNFLPSKSDCAKYLTKYIQNKDDIPSDIVTLFNTINKNGKTNIS